MRIDNLPPVSNLAESGGSASPIITSIMNSMTAFGKDLSQLPPNPSQEQVFTTVGQISFFNDFFGQLFVPKENAPSLGYLVNDMNAASTPPNTLNTHALMNDYGNFLTSLSAALPSIPAADLEYNYNFALSYCVSFSITSANTGFFAQSAMSSVDIDQVLGLFQAMSYFPAVSEDSSLTGFCTQVELELASLATQVEQGGGDQGLQTQINALSNAMGSYVQNLPWFHPSAYPT